MSTQEPMRMDEDLFDMHEKHLLPKANGSGQMNSGTDGVEEG